MLNWLLTYEAALTCLILALVVILFFVMAISCIAQQKLEEVMNRREVRDEKSKTTCQEAKGESPKAQEEKQ